jgi:hypothetical protein
LTLREAILSHCHRALTVEAILVNDMAMPSSKMGTTEEGTLRKVLLQAAVKYFQRQSEKEDPTGSVHPKQKSSEWRSWTRPFGSPMNFLDG